MPVNNIINHNLKYANEIVGDYGESAGVTCPFCHSRQYPKNMKMSRCSECGTPFRVPEGYCPRNGGAGYKPLLDQILREDHVAAGLQLREDEEFVHLIQNGREIATFSAYGVTFDEIWREADLALGVEVE